MSVRQAWEMACPGCSKDDRLEVAVTTWARLYADGTVPDDAEDGSHEWDNDSPCQCASCGWHGTVKGAKA